MSAKTSFEKLPDQAFLTAKDRGIHNSPTPVVAVKKGEKGFFPIQNAKTAQDLNTLFGVTPAQVEAMFAGSMFGWDTPAANPDLYDENGAIRQ